VGRYKVRYEREDGCWIVRVPSVYGCHSNGRMIEEARRRIREALGLFVDDADEAEFDEDIRLPPAVKRLVDAQLKARKRAEDEQAKAMSLANDVAPILVREVGLSRRDAGALLGLSHQRVQQMVEASAHPETKKRSGPSSVRARNSARTKGD